MCFVSGGDEYLPCVSFMELDHYEHPTAEKPQEEGERQRPCCALQRGPRNGLLDYDHKVFLLSGQAGRQPLAAPAAAPGERAHSGDLLVRMECSSVHSPPLGRVSR